MNNSFKPLNIQAWYYDFVDLGNAYWLEADFNIENILIGAQYGVFDADYGSNNDQAYALTFAYTIKDIATIKASYSSVDDKGAIGYVGNVATANHQSKLYTSMWWSSGIVDRTGADSCGLTVESTVGKDIDIYLAHSYSDVNPNDVNLDEFEFTETVAVINKSFGALDTAFALIHDNIDGKNIDSSSATHLQIYLTYNF